MVFFEAPHRLVETLDDKEKVFGSDRGGAICREMTKTYEETIRGSLRELSAWAHTNGILGEITLVIAGAPKGSGDKSSEEIIERVRAFEAAGMDRKEAIAEVAREFELPKRLVYATVVEANKMGK